MRKDQETIKRPDGMFNGNERVFDIFTVRKYIEENNIKPKADKLPNTPVILGDVTFFGRFRKKNTKSKSKPVVAQYKSLLTGVKVTQAELKAAEEKLESLMKTIKDETDEKISKVRALSLNLSEKLKEAQSKYDGFIDALPKASKIFRYAQVI